MTETPKEPQPEEYIITEEQLIDLLSYADCHDYLWTKQTEENIRSRPHPAPAPEVYGCNLDVVSPQKDCFGKYIWKDTISSDDECFICPVYGYCMDVSARSRKAREDVLLELINWLEPQKLTLLKQKVFRKLESLRSEQEQPR